MTNRLILTLEKIHPLTTVEEGVDLLIRDVTQEVANLQHALTDSETAQRIEKLVHGLQQMVGAAAHAVVANTEKLFEDVDGFFEDEGSDEDDSQTPAAPPAEDPPGAGQPVIIGIDPARRGSEKTIMMMTPEGPKEVRSDAQLTAAPIPPIGTPAAPATAAELVESLEAAHAAAKGQDENVDLNVNKAPPQPAPLPRDDAAAAEVARNDAQGGAAYNDGLAAGQAGDTASDDVAGPESLA